MIANARMYSVNATAKAAWRELLAWITDRAELRCEIIDYDAPAPLAALWSRDDLGCALMCGLPYALRDPVPQLIAAPIPSPLRYAGRAQYMTDLAVRNDAPFRSVEETFGSRIGYTVRDSQSGYFALRQFLEPFQRRYDGDLYRSVTGDLLNARGVIDALLAGTIDVGPLDSYNHDLLAHLEPDYARQVRVVGSTMSTPIPPFVSTTRLDAASLARLRSAFAAAGSAPELAAARATLLLDGFAFPEADDYAPLKTRHDAIIAAPEVW